MEIEPEKKGERPKQTSVEINAAISEMLSRSNRVRISGLSGQDNISVGITGNFEINIKGNAGRFLGAFNDGPVIVLQGSCGEFAGDSMLSGGLIVFGEAGPDAGLYMKGGALVIKGNAMESIAREMVNGTIIVDGDVIGMAGTGMTGGTLIITGSVKGTVGTDAIGGNLFLGGETGEMSGELVETALTDNDKQTLSRYFGHYSISAQPGTFKKFQHRNIVRGGK